MTDWEIDVLELQDVNQKSVQVRPGFITRYIEGPENNKNVLF